MIIGTLSSHDDDDGSLIKLKRVYFANVGRRVNECSLGMISSIAIRINKIFG